MKLDQLYEQLSHDFAGSVYAVTRTEKGFDVAINVVDAKYYAILHQQRVKRVFTHQIAVDEEADTMTITDVDLAVEWQRGIDVEGGVPKIMLRGSASGFKGTRVSFAKQDTLAWDENGRFGHVVGYTFRSEDARRLIKKRASELGLAHRMNNYAKIGVAFAILAGLVAIVVAITLLFVL